MFLEKYNTYPEKYRKSIEYVLSLLEKEQLERTRAENKLRHHDLKIKEFRLDRKRAFNNYSNADERLIILKEFYESIGTKIDIDRLTIVLEEESEDLLLTAIAINQAYSPKDAIGARAVLNEPVESPMKKLIIKGKSADEAVNEVKKIKQVVKQL